MIIASHSSWNGEVLQDKEGDAEVLSEEILEWSVKGSPEEDIVVFDDGKDNNERKEGKGKAERELRVKCPPMSLTRNVDGSLVCQCWKLLRFCPCLASGREALEWNRLGGTDETGARPRPYAVAASCKVWFIGNSR